MAEEKESKKNNGVDKKTEENNAAEEIEDERGEQETGEEEEVSDEETEEGAEEKEETPRGPRFDLVEIILLLLIGILSDLLDPFWIFRFIFALIILAWFHLKGVKGIGKNVIAQAVEIIPGINWLPITTVAILLTIWSTNNPESFNKVFGIVGKILKAKKS